MNRWVSIGLVLAAVLALALRLPLLDQRPMHNDEAVNAIKFGELWERGAYKYDPNEHHGPTLIYATYIAAWLTGAPDFVNLGEARLRLVSVVFGVALILALPLVIDGLGRRAVLWAAFLTALSPAMAFYSRYYIHELLLVFSAFLAIAAAWRYWRSRRIGWALLAGASAGFMHATKETFVISLIAAGLALASNQVWNRWFDASGPPVKAPRLNGWHVAAGFGIWILVASAFFSSFFTNASGPFDSIRTYAPWLQRAGGDSPHIYPWYYYLKLITWFQPGKGPAFTEALILFLALVGAAAGFIRKRLGRANASFIRFLSLYTFALTAGYSIISYKTPWCLLNFWHGVILLAGVGAVVILRSLRPRPARFAAAAALVAGCLHLAWEAWQADVPLAADQRNPYVFAHTSPDVLNLVAKLNLLAKASPEGTNTLVKVISAESDYWPLPWYLRAFKQVGWWDAMPPDPYAPVMIVSSKFEARLDDKKTHLMVGYFQLRPQTFLELYVQLDLWRAYLAQNPPRPED
jgi:uncharacterized protein (TIGR03663 family)